MNEKDFLFIEGFTASEVRATGANLKDVQFRTLYSLGLMRGLLRVHYSNCKIRLLPNGLTTGKHKSPAHARGDAVDWYSNKKIRDEDFIVCAAVSGFRDLGIYWNGKIKSYHTAIDQHADFWSGTKKTGETEWTYKPLIR